MFSIFRDTKDWRSVEVVDVDAFEEKFGAGVELKEVSIEVTKEPVTHIIEKYLPPLDTQEKYHAYLTWLQSLKMDDPRKQYTSAYMTP